jgi:hypothetical protein
MKILIVLINECDCCEVTINKNKFSRSITERNILYPEKMFFINTGCTWAPGEKRKKRWGTGCNIDEGKHYSIKEGGVYLDNQ